MARIKYNVVTHGVSGKVGDLLVYRQRHGKTIIAKIASRPSKYSALQQLVRIRFCKAVNYAN